MKTSESGKQFLIKLEGLKLKAYKDSGGVPTIGVGSLDMPSGKLVKMGDTITQQEAMDLLTADLRTSEKALAPYENRLNQKQYDALVCFIFNIGTSAFANSTLLKELIAGRSVDAQWVRWNKDNGKVVQGLVNRRAKELALFNGGSY